MQAITGETQFVIAITLLLLVIVSFVIIFVFVHQRKYHKYLQEIDSVKNAYQQEILKAQLEMQEQTFLSISHEIHDNIGQVLSLIRLNISTFNLNDFAATAHKITTSKELLDEAIEDLRNLSKRLNTDYVIKKSLPELLHFQLDLIKKTGTFISTTFEAQGSEKAINPEKKQIIFRMAQEALNNIIKHAAAKNIAVLLTYLPEQIILHITDDGKGFAVADEEFTKGIGIQNLYYRANIIGAALAIQSQPENGTQIILTIPYSK